MVPSQGIHSIGLTFPIDLVFLDADSHVIHMIEQYRPFRVGPLRMRSHSVLELPARSLYWSDTQIGDEILICPPENLAERWRAGSVQAALRGQEGAMGRNQGPSQAKPNGQKATAGWLRGWFRSILDRRDAQRAPITGLTAYYWDGGLPTPHEVTNLSDTGAYIQSASKWYPGTVIELTLQLTANNAGKLPGEKMAVQLPCRVVRCGPDGVGVRFLFSEPATRRAVKKLRETIRNGRS